LKESSFACYLQRPEWNVRDSDATILFSSAPTLRGGSKKTVEFTRKLKKPFPWVHIHAAMSDASKRLKAFLEDNVIEVINVAGPRGSKEPKLPQFVFEILNRVFDL
jgi:putative molybdenum carrier protein